MEHFGLKNLNELPNASELRSLALPSAKISAEAQFKNPADATAESPESNATDIREPEGETEAKIAVTPDPSDHQHDSTERG
jgi:hypothetical protein